MIRTADRSTTLWLAGLHLVLALSLPLILIVMAGCKQAHSRKEDLGPAVDPDAIQKILNDAVKDASFDNLKVDNYTYYLHTRRLENQENVVQLGSRRVDVIDRQDTDTQAHFTLKITLVERTDTDKFRTIVSEDPLWLTKVGSSVSTSSTASLRELISDVSSSDGPAQPKVTFHNLTQSLGEIDPPARMRGRPDCGGLSPCRMHVRYVLFDMVIWEPGGGYQKISFDLTFSLDASYLPYGQDFDQFNGALINDCRSTLIPVQSTNVYVRDCFTLDDFKR
jgi:hypothetical protein